MRMLSILGDVGGFCCGFGGLECGGGDVRSICCSSICEVVEEVWAWPWAEWNVAASEAVAMLMCDLLDQRVVRGWR